MSNSLILPLFLLILVVPLFLASRRQKKAMAEMQNLQSSLEPGDQVMTTSGVRGVVIDVDSEDTIDLEIAPGVVTTWIRAAVREKIKPVVVQEDAEDAVEDDAETVVTTEPAKAEAAKPTS